MICRKQQQKLLKLFLKVYILMYIHMQQNRRRKNKVVSALEICRTIFFHLRYISGFGLGWISNLWLPVHTTGEKKNTPVKIYIAIGIILFDVATWDSHDVYNSILHSTVSTAYVFLNIGQSLIDNV